MIINYDRLNGIDMDENQFKFVCPKCNKDGIKNPDLINVHLIGVSTKPDTVDNSDLNEEYQKFYNSLPTIREAILAHVKDTETERLQLVCTDCGQLNVDNNKISRFHLRKWANKKYPEVLILWGEKYVNNNSNKNNANKNTSRLYS